MRRVVVLVCALVLLSGAGGWNRVVAMDFGNGPVAPGWTGIADNDPRWLGDGGSVNRGGPNALYGDGILCRDRTLTLAVPNGHYYVRAMFGDPARPHDLQEMYVGGARIGGISTRAGQYTLRAGLALVVDGQLVVRFHDAGGIDPQVYVSYLEVFNVD